MTTQMILQFDINWHKDDGWYWGLLTTASSGTPAHGIPGYYVLTSDDFNEPYFKTRAACVKSVERARKQLLGEIAKAPVHDNLPNT